MNENLKQVGVLLLMVGMLTSCKPAGPAATPTLPGESLEWEKTADLQGHFTFVLVANDKEITRQQHIIP